ncbi:MAG: hypothetical protein ACK5PW_14905 [Burkholderiales bacterium]
MHSALFGQRKVEVKRNALSSVAVLSRNASAVPATPRLSRAPATARSAGTGALSGLPHRLPAASAAPAAANNIVRLLRSSGLPTPAASQLAPLAAGLSEIGRRLIDFAPVARRFLPFSLLSLGGDSAQRFDPATAPLPRLTQSFATLDQTFEALDGLVTATTPWPDFSGQRAALQTLLTRSRQQIRGLAVSRPEQAARQLAALFDLFELRAGSTGGADQGRLAAARGILARSRPSRAAGRHQAVPAPPSAAAPGPTAGAASRPGIDPAVAAARTRLKAVQTQAGERNQQVVAQQRTAAAGWDAAQESLARFYWQAAGQRAAQPALRGALGEVEARLQALRTVYRQANAPVAALKAARQQLGQIAAGDGGHGLATQTAQARKQVSSWAQAADAWRGRLSEQINALAQWQQAGQRYVQALAAPGAGAREARLPTLPALTALQAPAGGLAPEAAQAARKATAALHTWLPGDALRPQETDAPGTDRAASPAAEIDTDSVRQTVALLTPQESEDWQRYTERFPDIADLIRQAAHDATDAELAEAIRMLLRGATGQEVVAALRNDGVASGGLPPGRRTPPAALAGEGPESDNAFPDLPLHAPAIGDPRQGRRARPHDAAVVPSGPATARPLQPFEIQSPGLLPLPSAAPALRETRTGFHFSFSIPGSYELFVRAWTQDGNPLPALLWPELINTFDRRGPMEAIADTLSKRLPPEISWRVSMFPPSPIGLSSFGLERLSSLVLEIEPAVASGAVKYDPRKKTYSLNLIETPEGRRLAAPLAVQVVEARGVAPFDIPGLPSLPLHPSWKHEVLKVWNVTLDGPIDAQLAAAITRAINQGALCKELWYQPGQIKARAKWRVRFALPGSVAREGTHRLPKGWSNLAARLLSPDRRETPDQVLKSHWLGIKFRAGLTASLQGYRQSITSSPTYANNQPNLWAPSPTQPHALEPAPLPDLAFVPGRVPGVAGRIVLHAPAGAEEAAPAGRERLDPKAVTRLVLPDAGNRRIAISGAVLNALNGHAVQASDLPAITQFLRSLDIASIGRGRSDRGVLSWNAGVVYEVMSAFERGQPFPPETIETIYTAIETFVESLPSASGTLNLPGP